MISDRLKTIAKMLDKGKIVADIGSDHALLPCYLLLENYSSKVYSIDNKPGPLQGALENIEKYQLVDKVIPILASGLDELPLDTQAIIIAGMGFDTISEIISQNISKAQALESIIIQSNTDWHKLRAILKSQGFSIMQEEFIISRNKEYLFVKASHTGQSNINNVYVGDYLMHDSSYRNYMREQVELYSHIVEYNEEIKDLHSNLKQALDTHN